MEYLTNKDKKRNIKENIQKNRSMGFFLQLLIWNWKNIAKSSKEGATFVHCIKKETWRPLEGAF